MDNLSKLDQRQTLQEGKISVPIGASELGQVRDVAGHQERRLRDGLVDLHMQVDETEVFVIGHRRHERVSREGM